MKKSNLGKKLLAVITAAVLSIGCVETAFAYDPTDKDIKALDISNIVVSAVNDDDDKVEAVALTMTDELKAQLGLFYAYYPTADIHKIFGVKGTIDDDGTSVRVADAAVTSKTKHTVYQWDKDKEEWKKITPGRAAGFLRFSLSRKTPVIITKNNPKKVNVKSITLEAKKLEKKPGETFNIAITGVNPANFIGMKQTWKSSNEDVAKVDKNTGVITTKKDGSTSISVRIANKSVSCRLKVCTKVEDIALMSTVKDIPTEGEAYIALGLIPANASNKNIKWEIVGSRGKKIASLKNKKNTGCTIKIKKASKNGPQPGETVTVRATAKDGSKVYKEITFTVATLLK